MRTNPKGECEYSQGEYALCFQGPLLYEAKIINVKTQAGKYRYYIHYKGWNKSWDEWVGDERLLKINEENLIKQKQLESDVKNVKKKSSSKKTSGSSRRVKSESEDSSREASKDREVLMAAVVRVKRLRRSRSGSAASETNTDTGKVAGSTSKTEPTCSVTKSKTRTIKPVNVFEATTVPKSMKKKKKKDKDTPSSKTDKERLFKKTTSGEVKEPKVKQISIPKPNVREFGKEVEFPLTAELKTRLVDDFDYIDRQRKLVQLPARITVSDLLDQFYTTVRSGKRNKEACSGVEEVCSGLKDYFNSTLGSQLLYKFERVQYADCLKERPGLEMSHLYGPVHLLRLLTKLGHLLTSAGVDQPAIDKIAPHLNHLIRFLHENQETFFLVGDYGTATPEYHRRSL